MKKETYGESTCSCGNYFNPNIKKGVICCSECYTESLKKDKGLVDRVIQGLKEKYNVNIPRKNKENKRFSKYSKQATKR